MKHIGRIIALLVSLMALVAPASPSLAQSEPPLAYDLVGDIDGAAYKIKVPEAWNGTLLVYAHGYPVLPDTDPEITFPDDLMKDLLLEKGYALAASGYRGAGWNLQEGIEDTKALVALFEEEVEEPDRVILYGVSMGGDVALKSIELYPETYDGIIPIGSTAGGPFMDVDHLLDLAVAYDAVFGWHPDWGEPGDVTIDLDPGLLTSFYGSVMPKVYPEVFDYQTGEPINIAEWEFIRRVTHTQLGGYYSYEGPLDLPPSVILQTFFMTVQVAELQMRAGGPVQENVGRVYSLSRRDIQELGRMGLDAEALLAEMNAHTDIEADPDARAWIADTGAFSGEISTPVLMAHTVEDSLISAEHTLAYEEMLKAVGTDDWLVRVYSDLPGHCNFTHEQMLALFAAMETWLDTGKRPNPAQFPITLDFTHRASFGNMDKP